MNSQHLQHMLFPISMTPHRDRGPYCLPLVARRPSPSKLQSLRSLAKPISRKDFWFCCGLPLVLVVASITVIL